MEYEIRRSARKTVALEITDRAALLVRAPLKMSDREIEGFVLKYRGWAEEKLKTAQKRAAHEQSITEREKELREKAEHNHSAAFYKLIERYMPDYRSRRALLRTPE